MRVGVKYCGGCNPRYDRVKFVTQLKQELGEGIEWLNASTAENTLDFVLVVCGCTAACAEHRQLNGTYGKLVVRAPTEYDAALEQLFNLKNRDGGPEHGLEDRL